MPKELPLAQNKLLNPASATRSISLEYSLTKFSWFLVSFQPFVKLYFSGVHKVAFKPWFLSVFQPDGGTKSIPIRPISFAILDNSSKENWGKHQEQTDCFMLLFITLNLFSLAFIMFIVELEKKAKELPPKIDLITFLLSNFMINISVNIVKLLFV